MVSSCRMSVLKPKIIGIQAFPGGPATFLLSRQVLPDKSTVKNVPFALTLPLVKTSLESLLMLLTQIIYSQSYAGQSFRSVPAPPIALRHRAGACERDCNPFRVGWPA